MPFPAINDGKTRVVSASHTSRVSGAGEIPSSLATVAPVIRSAFRSTGMTDTVPSESLQTESIQKAFPRGATTWLALDWRS